MLRLLLGLIIGSVVLTACVVPVRYEVEVDVAPDGSYAMRYEGTIAHVPLRMMLLEGESELSLREDLQAVMTDLAAAPGVLSAVYIGAGVYRVVAETTVGPMETESLFDAVAVTREPNRLVFRTEGLGSDVWDLYEELELEHEGHVVIRSDAIVRSSNGDGGPQVYTWNAEALRRSGILFQVDIPTEAQSRCFRDPTSDCFLALAVQEIAGDGVSLARLRQNVNSKMVRHHRDLGDFEGAAQILVGLEASEARDLAQGLARAQLAAGDFAGARTTALAHRSAALVAIVTEGLVAAGEIDEARLLAAEAYPSGSPLRSETMRKISVQQMSFGDEAGATQTIEEALGELRATGVSGSSMAQAYAPYATILAELGRVGEAQVLVDEVAAAGESPLPVAVAVRSGRVRSLLRAASFAEALELAGEIEDARVRDPLLRDMIAVLLEREDLAMAVQAVEALLDPVGWNDVVPVAMAQARRGDTEAALGTLKSLPEGPYRQVSEAVMLAVVGRFEDALALTETYEWETKDWALSSIASEQVDAGDTRGAVGTIARLTSGDSGFLERMIEKLLQAGAVDDAYAMIAAVGEAGPGFETIVRFISDSMIEAQAMAGDIEGAWRSVAVLNRDGYGAHEIVKAHLATGDILGAAATIERMAPTSGAYWWALRDLAVAQAEAGDIPGALRTVDLLEAVKDTDVTSVWLYFDAVDGVAWRVARAGDPDRAQAMVDRAVPIAYSVRVQGLASRLAALSTTMGRIESLR